MGCVTSPSTFFNEKENILGASKWSRLLLRRSLERQEELKHGRVLLFYKT
jgi:hypothetical protein